MRSYIPILITLLVIGGVIGYLGFQEYQTYQNQSPTTLVVALDISDNDLSLPTSEFVIEQSGISQNPFGETTIEFVLVTDEEIAPIRRLHLDKVFKWTTNERLRRKTIHEFTESVDEILYEIEAMNRELKHSAIYTHVNAALERLNQVSGTKKLILASDGFEHTERFSVYHGKKLQKARFTPENYAKNLAQIEAPVEITDVEIIFYLNPEGRLESVYQKQVVEAYSLLFPEAHISIQAI